MKKTYIEPIITIVAVRSQNVLAGSLNGDGLNMRINSSSTTGAADSRRDNSDWDDEE